MWVHKDEIHIDRGYQRDLNESKRTRIAAHFDWGAFGVLLLARRASDGTLWAFDGQHRLAAVRSRSDIQEVPAAVYELATSEASAFLTVNKERAALKGIETFRAMVESGNPHAVRVGELVAQAGRRVGHTNPNSVACVRQMQRSLELDAKAFEVVWPVIVALCDGSGIDHRLVTAIHYVERRLIDWDGNRRSLGEEHIRRRILGIGLSSLMEAMGEAAAYFKKGGDRVWARGCLNALNYKLSKRYGLREDA